MFSILYWMYKTTNVISWLTINWQSVLCSELWWLHSEFPSPLPANPHSSSFRRLSRDATISRRVRHSDQNRALVHNLASYSWRINSHAPSTVYRLPCMHAHRESRVTPVMNVVHRSRPILFQATFKLFNQNLIKTRHMYIDRARYTYNYSVYFKRVRI